MRTLLVNHKDHPLSVSIVPGSITLQQTAKKPPLSINQWTTCFHVFMAIYLNKKLEKAPHLLKYCEFIHDLNFDYGDKAWHFYNEAISQLCETHCAPWQVPGLVQNKFQKQQPFCSKERICYTFNHGESCSSTCTYKHACAYCKSGHNKFSCPKLLAKSGGNQTSSQFANQQKRNSNYNKGGNLDEMPAKVQVLSM